MSYAEFMLKANDQHRNSAVTPEYLDWLESIYPRFGVSGNEAWNAGVAWAIAQKQEQGEPVASDAYDKIDRFLRNNLGDVDYAEYSNALDNIYTTPQQRTWVGLTDEEIDEINGSPIRLEHSGQLLLVRAIEAKLKEKNT